MRVATYTQPALQAQGSFFAILMLVLTIVLGSSAAHSTLFHFAPQLTPVVTLAWVANYVVALFGLMFVHGINWISWIARYRILLVVLLLGCMASVTWSLIPGVSAERVVHLLGCSILAIYIGFMVPLLTILRVFAVVLGGLMLATVASAIALPDFGIENYEGIRVWKGVFGSKNSLGFWSSIAVLLYISLIPSTRSLFFKFVALLMAAISMVVLIQSQSATSLLALVVAGSICIYMYIAIRFKLGFFRMAVMAVLFVGLLSMLAANIDTAALVGRSGDLTGRGEVWAQTWKLILSNPLKGFGYGALWFPTDDTLWVQERYTDFSWKVYHAHNGFLHVASEIGLPLTCIALLMVAQQLIEIFYCQYQKQQVGVLFVLGFVIAYLISNYSEARFLVNQELYWIFFIALPISMLRQINVEAEDQGYQQAQATGQSVPGKPWLNPQPHQVAGAAMGVEGASQLSESALADQDVNLDDADVADSTLNATLDYGAVMEETDETLSFTTAYDPMDEEDHDKYEKRIGDRDDDDLDDTQKF